MYIQVETDEKTGKGRFHLQERGVSICATSARVKGKRPRTRLVVDVESGDPEQTAAVLLDVFTLLREKLDPRRSASRKSKGSRK